MPRRALVLIDIQNDYFPGGKWALSGIESAADNAARVLAAARAAGDLVVHVRHEFPTAGAPFFARGNPGPLSEQPLDGHALIPGAVMPRGCAGTRIRDLKGVSRLSSRTCTWRCAARTRLSFLFTRPLRSNGRFTEAWRLASSGEHARQTSVIASTGWLQGLRFQYGRQTPFIWPMTRIIYAQLPFFICARAVAHR